VSVTEEVRLGHENLIAYSKASTGWGRRGSFEDDDDVLLYATGSWLPVGCNGAFRHHGADPTRLIDRADGFFGSLGRGYSVKVRDTGEDDDLAAACEANELAAFGDPVPQMVCRRRLEIDPPPDGVTLRAAVDADGVADFVAVNTDAYATYGMPDDVLGDTFDRPEAVLADDRTRIVVAYLDGRPLATALTFLSHGVGCLQWVGTVAEVRRMRLGRVVTAWATNASFDMGASSVTLQASPMGHPLYAALGYETLYHYREHVRWNAPAP
jgi:Acetyltransferase (GNAT) domain